MHTHSVFSRVPSYRSSTTNHLYIEYNNVGRLRRHRNEVVLINVYFEMTHRHVIGLLNRPIFKDKRNYNIHFGLKSLEGRSWSDVCQISNDVLMLKVWVVHLRGSQH